MPIYQLNNIIETQILVRCLSGMAMNQVYFRCKQNLPASTTFSDTIRNAYWDSYGRIVSSSAEIFAVKSRKVDPGPLGTYVQEAFTIRFGLGGTSYNAEGLSNIITLSHANTLGRSGRMYSPFPPGGAYVTGLMDNVHLGRLNTCVSELNAKFASGGSNAFLEQCVKTRVPTIGTIIYAPVLTYSFELFMGWQRSRIRFRGI